MSDIIERNSEEWIKREEELLHQITNLIQINDNVVATNDDKLKSSNESLSKLSIENELLKKKLAKLEVELEETKAMSKSQVMTQVKEKYEDILLKAKNLLFENQKTMQNQQVQLEAYKSQTESLKEVIGLTKDMLNIRNCENENLEAKFEAMDIKFKAESDRQKLLEKKFTISSNLYNELKQEYSKQKSIFTGLQLGYKAKISSLEDQLNEKLNGNA